MNCATGSPKLGRYLKDSVGQSCPHFAWCGKDQANWRNCNLVECGKISWFAVSLYKCEIRCLIFAMALWLHDNIKLCERMQGLIVVAHIPKCTHFQILIHFVQKSPIGRERKTGLSRTCSGSNLKKVFVELSQTKT